MVLKEGDRGETHNSPFLLKTLFSPFVPSCHFPFALSINCWRRLVAKALVPSLKIVIPEILFQPPVTLQPVVGREQVYVLVLYAAPEAFDKYVVQCPSLSVHAQAYALFRGRGPVAELVRGELAPLVGVEDLRCAMFPDGGCTITLTTNKLMQDVTISLTRKYTELFYKDSTKFALYG